MSQPSPVCPDCQVAMESGFIVDFTHGTHASEQESWVEGKAESSWWTGWTGLKLGDRERLPVVTFRCPVCGLLKSFARAT